MKKSRCFWLAQMAVLSESSLLPSEKLEILGVLMEEENIQKICERQQAIENKKESEAE